MLFHMLPASLSNAMAGTHVTEIKNDPVKYEHISENLQNILNSNYGVFYLLITHENIKPEDIENGNYNNQEHIFYETKNQGLVDVLDKGYIAHSDLILYPQPICNTASYSEPKSEGLVINQSCQAEIQKAVSERKVKVLGRVHYIKGKTPDFWMISKQFNQNPLGQESGYHFIRHNLLFTFAGFFLVYWLIRLFLKHTALQHELSEQQHKLSRQENRAREEIYQRGILEAQLKRIEAENKLLKIREFDRVFRDEIDTIFTAEISNGLQKLDNYYLTILKRLETDINNISHDIRKAPLLHCIDVIRNALIRIRQTESNDDKIEIILEVLEKTDISIQTINQVISNLQEMISLEPQLHKLSDLLAEFELNLPPIVKNVPIEFFYQDCDCLIKINRWHFKSIIKNILFNSRRALVNKMLDDEKFAPKIKVSCLADKDNSKIQLIIEDNGDGIPESLLDKLYQVPIRLNTSNGNLNGNGSMIVFAYLALHEGQATVENLEGGGARVMITFPIADQKNSLSLTH